MRIWSLHPKYLDVKGLVALWRETLLAKHVLEGKSRGYANHPQLNRFKASSDPIGRINQYLSVVHAESESRGYKFDRSKITWNFSFESMTVTQGQLQYEWAHLLRKLESRDPGRLVAQRGLSGIKSHPMFTEVEGGIEDWEIRH